MRFDVALTDEAHVTSSEHLLQHYRRDALQEDLCFALWRPSTGEERVTALIDEVILPEEGDRLLHGNASFTPDYIARAVRLALRKNAGLAFMHSHPGSGWQGMSAADVEAERDVLAYPAGATGLPLVGLTIGRDAYWSARFWEKHSNQMRRSWCEKTRIVGPSTYGIHFNERLRPAPGRRDVLRRTFDTWGYEGQGTVSRLHVGIVGLGSVGCLVAEALARMGIERFTLIDPDRVEEHNLDRLLYGTRRDIGRLKVEVAAGAMRLHATASNPEILSLPIPLQDERAYLAALDCDVLFSCVDRPIPRDVLNYVANAHLVPVIDGGIAVQVDTAKDSIFSAHWRAHITTPYHQCLRCNGQYNSSMVVMELDGSLDDPSYISNLPRGEHAGNENVFPFSQSVAAMEVNLMLRYLLAPDWWYPAHQQTYQLITGETEVTAAVCNDFCSFRSKRAQGDVERPFYVRASDDPSQPAWQRFFRRLTRVFGRRFSIR